MVDILGAAEAKVYLVLSFHLASSQSLLGKNQILFIHVQNGEGHRLKGTVGTYSNCKVSETSLH